MAERIAQEATLYKGISRADRSSCSERRLAPSATDQSASGDFQIHHYGTTASRQTATCHVEIDPVLDAPRRTFGDVELTCVGNQLTAWSNVGENFRMGCRAGKFGTPLPYFIGRHRLSDQITLHIVATLSPEELKLLLGLDPLAARSSCQAFDRSSATPDDCLNL